MKRLIFLTLVTVLTVAFTGCESTTPNTNTTKGNVNGNLNSNTGVLVPTNNTPTNTTTNRWNNTNVSRADYDKNKADYEKDKGEGTIGTGANDSWIWFKTRAALLATADLRESTINVDVANDKITLRGTVATAEQKKKAEDVAKGIEGQKGVTNQLKVAKDDSMTNTSLTDSDKPKTNSNTKK